VVRLHSDRKANVLFSILLLRPFLKSLHWSMLSAE
jgi:hypothetical protein